LIKIKALLTFFLISSVQLLADNKSVVTQSANTVIEVLEDKTFVKHLTPYIFDIARNGHLLPDETKSKLKSLGFDFSGNMVIMQKSTYSDYYYDTVHFRIHYNLTGTNAVDNTDSDGDSIPDYIETMANIFEDVYNHDINELGYIKPPYDGIGFKDGSNAFDIEVKSTNAYGWTNYGALVGDNKNSPNIIENNAYTSNIVMRNNYNGFPNTELENIQVTAAHEFFHAIQLGYDGEEEIWMMEATAVWMEEEHYDDVNDCYQYMIPWFEKPHISLTSWTGLHPYGSFIFFKYIDEHLGGPDIIKWTWEQSRNFNSNDDNYSIQSIDLALKSVNHSFKKTINNMAIANCILSSESSAGQFAYEEASDYHNYREYSYYDTLSIQLGIADSVDFHKDIPQIITSYNLQKYGSQYIKINTVDPVKVSIIKPAGEPDPISDLSLHTISRTNSGNYEIQSGQILNVDPSSNNDWIYAVIVANGIDGTNYNYELSLTNGIKNAITDFIILSPFPNPFNNSTNIKLKIITPQNIDITVYDILGRKVDTIFSGNLTNGVYEYTWNGVNSNNEDVSSGIYYITAVGDNRQEWKKITLVK